MASVILGINGDAWGHDQSVAVMADGKVVFAIEEERVSRHKINHTFPYFAVEYALDYCNLKASDLDLLAFSWTFSPFNFRFWYPFRKECFTAGVSVAEAASATLELPLLQAFRRLELYCSTEYLERDRRTRLRVVQIPHHLAHMAAGYAESGYDECAVCVVDGTGEIETTSGYHCRGGRFERIFSMTYPDSLGLVYGGVTQHLGYRICRDEYKVMALAALGREDPALTDFFRSLIVLDNDGGFHINRRSLSLRRWSDQVYPTYFSLGAALTLGPARDPGSPLKEHHCNVAFALQRRTEEAIFHVLRGLQKRTGCRHLVLTGGVALNSVCNGRILDQTGFESLFVPAAPSDSGTAIGAALLAPDPAVLPAAAAITPYLGPKFADHELERAIVCAGLRCAETPHPEREVARWLCAGDLVGWFQGRMEFGPRALGNRSILADPSQPDVHQRLNSLKGRENFRPFGISVPEHRAAEVCRSLRHSSRMMMVDTLRDPLALEGVSHVDQTTRLHTVTRDDNPRFYALLNAFNELSGLPGVLNTSFNVGGEPIVCSPMDALRTFSASQLDALCLGSLLIRKQDAVESPAHSSAISEIQRPM